MITKCFAISGVENQDSTKSSGGRGGEIIQGQDGINPEEDLGTRPMPGGLMGSVHSDGGKQLGNTKITKAVFIFR